MPWAMTRFEHVHERSKSLELLHSQYAEVQGLPLKLDEIAYGTAYGMGQQLTYSHNFGVQRGPILRARRFISLDIGIRVRSPDN
jgi:hypothetical protein